MSSFPRKRESSVFGPNATGSPRPCPRESGGRGRRSLLHRRRGGPSCA